MEKYYRHFKGGLYKFIGIAKDSETLEDLVVYQAMYGDNQLWVRPAGMFFEKVERDGKVMDRFQEVTIAALEPILSRYEPLPQPTDAPSLRETDARIDELFREIDSRG